MSGQPAFRCDDAQGNESFLGPSSLAAVMGGEPAENRAAIDPCHDLKRRSVMLSLAVHAALLAWLVQTAAIPAGRGQPPESIRVEVIAVAPPADPQEETVHKVEPAPPQPVATPIPSSKPPTAVSQPAKVKLHRATSQPASPVVAAIESVDGPTTPPNVPSVPSDIVPAPSVVGATAPAVAEDGLRLYGETIRARILAHKPTHIRLRGTVGLTFSISHDGRLLATAVSMSSGSDALDQAALAAVQEAAPFPTPPEMTSSPQLTFSIPFQFR